MKKLFMISLVMFGLVFGIKSVNAMTEEELITKMTKAYTINGSEYKMDDADIVLLKRYLKEYDLSSADADYISSKVDAAISIVKKSGKTNFKDFSKQTKEDLKKLVEDVSANTSVKASVTSGSVVVYTPEGTKTFAEVTKLVKQTGTSISISNIVIAGISLIVVLAGSVIITKELKAGK